MSQHSFTKFELLQEELKTTAVFDGVGGELITRIARWPPRTSNIWFYGFLVGSNALIGAILNDYGEEPHEEDLQQLQLCNRMRYGEVARSARIPPAADRRPAVSNEDWKDFSARSDLRGNGIRDAARCERGVAREQRAVTTAGKGGTLRAVTFSSLTISRLEPGCCGSGWFACNTPKIIG